MLPPTELYPLVLAWLQALGAIPHATGQAAVAHLVTALLVGQSLRPAALMRALMATEGVPARQRYKRVARAWTRRWLAPGWLTPPLVRAVLALVAPDGPHSRTAGLTHLALDSVRCGGWEIFTLGVVWHGRVLPVGWAVLPYPWPKGTFTPTVCGLVRQVAAAWPAARPAHLVGDRAFPSRALFAELAAARWGWTIRLRATNPVTVAGQPGVVRDLLSPARAGAWTAWAGAYGHGARAVPGRLVVGRGLVVLPHHQRGSGSLRRRAAQQARRRQHLATKHPGQAPDGSRATDAWVVLFTTHADWLAAQTSYRLRWGIEGSYRDAQGGWDGQHGWDLEPVVAAQVEAHTVEVLVGLWALGALLQSWVGAQAGQPSAPAPVRAVVRQWTTTGRLSVWARGKFALTEPSGALGPWLRTTFRAGAQRLARAAPPAPRPLSAQPAPPLRRAA